jgi:hypothetical protein
MKCAVLYVLALARSARHSASPLLDLAAMAGIGHKWCATLVDVSFPSYLAGKITLLVVLAVFSKRAAEE